MAGRKQKDETGPETYFKMSLCPNKYFLLPNKGDVVNLTMKKYVAFV